VQESEEIVGTDEYPVDNRFSDLSLTVDREVSREVSNELIIDHGGIPDGLGLEAIEAEIKEKFCKETGHKIGENVAERRKLSFSVDAGQSVLYKVTWKRRVRSCNRRYLVRGDPLTILYRIHYGLSHEVNEQPLEGGDRHLQVE